jgi:hypothetical protein
MPSIRHSGPPSSAVAMIRRVDDPESRKMISSKKPLDPPVKPGDDGFSGFLFDLAQCSKSFDVIRSSESSDVTQDHESFNFVQDREPVERLVEGAAEGANEGKRHRAQGT